MGVERLKDNINKLQIEKDTFYMELKSNKKEGVQELGVMYNKGEQLKKDMDSLYLTAYKETNSSVQMSESKEVSEIDIKKEFEQLKNNNYLYLQQVLALKHGLMEQQNVFKNGLEATHTYKESIEEIELRERREKLKEAKSSQFDEVQEKIKLIELELEIQNKQFKKIIKDNDSLFSPLKGKLLDLPSKELPTKKELKKLIINTTQPMEQNIRATKISDKPEFYVKWKYYTNDNKAQSKILVEVLKDSECKIEYATKHIKLIITMLQEGFSSEDYNLYEAATICLNELLGIRRIELDEFGSLRCECKVIRGLLEQREGEVEEYVIERHVNAINILAYIDDLKIDWTQEMTIELDGVDGLTTLNFYIENYDEFQDIAIKALQVLTYFASYKENHYLLKGTEIFNTIISITYQAKLLILKQLASECLVLFTQADTLKNELRQDIRVKELLMEMVSKRVDTKCKGNLIVFFLNLTEEAQFKKILCNYGIVDVLISLLLNTEDQVHIIYALRIANNIACENYLSKTFYKLIAPLLRILSKQRNSDIIVQTLITILSILEADSENLINEYSKLLPYILISIRSVEEEIICQALRVLNVILNNGGESFVKQAVMNGEPIKVCVLLYCTHENSLMITASKALIGIFARHGYIEEIGAIGKVTLMEKLFSSTNNEEALEILGYLSDHESNREYICCVEGIHKYINVLVELLISLDSYVYFLILESVLSLELRYLLIWCWLASGSQ